VQVITNDVTITDFIHVHVYIQATGHLVPFLCRNTDLAMVVHTQLRQSMNHIASLVNCIVNYLVHYVSSPDNSLMLTCHFPQY